MKLDTVQPNILKIRHYLVLILAKMIQEVDTFLFQATIRLQIRRVQSVRKSSRSPGTKISRTLFGWMQSKSVAEFSMPAVTPR